MQNWLWLHLASSWVNTRRARQEIGVAAAHGGECERLTNITKSNDTITRRVRRGRKVTLEKDDRKNVVVTGTPGSKVDTARGRVKAGAREEAADEIIDLYGSGYDVFVASLNTLSPSARERTKVSSSGGQFFAGGRKDAVETEPGGGSHVEDAEGDK